MPEMSERNDPAAATPPPETTPATPSLDQPPHLRLEPRQEPASPVDLLDRFLRVARRSPDEIAVAETRRRRQVTYGELDRTTRRLAHRLREEGVGPETVVGVTCRRGIDLVVGALSIWRAGGVYLPLDPAYPIARLEAMVETARPHRLLVADDGPTPQGSLAAGPTLSIGPSLDSTHADDPSTVESSDPPSPDPHPHPLQAAYILFTSGTSGRPKGVVVTRLALSWYADAARDHYRLSANDRVLQLASASFDISIGEIFPALAVGATVVVDNRGTATEVFERCRDHRITVLFPATVLWHELALQAAEDPGVVPDSLRLVSFGGERVSQQRLEGWLATVGHRSRLVNGYGPTEATVEATVYDLSAEGAVVNGRRIGRPVLGVRVAVVDGQGTPVEAGEEGELVVSSTGLARGYLGQPRTTAERFTPDPATKTPGGRRYRTGDLVRQAADGVLEITGRCDRQTKIRGLRIEPEEVEHLLEQHPEVRAAVVAAVDDGHGSQQLVALVVPRGAATHGTSSGEDSPPDPMASATGAGVLGVGSGSSGQWTRRLRRHLAPHLPAPLRPVRYLLRDHLPTTPAGKIDRRQVEKTLTRDHRLGPPDSVASDGARGAPSPGTTPASLEQQLATLWQRILGIDPPSPQASFFELGGDSILALRIVAEATRQGLPLTPADLFEHPTLERLAARLATRSPAPSGATPPKPALVEPERGARKGAPLTPVQGWFFEEAALAEPHHFNQSMQWTPTRRLEAERLRRALARVVEHHQALRTRFRLGDGWSQWVADREPSQLVLEADLSGLSRHHRRRAHQQVAEAIQSSLDLARGPLVRAALIELGPATEADAEAQSSEQRLLLAIHHLVVDGVSWSIVVEDLERAYEGASELDPTGLDYIDWARLQSQQAGAPPLTDEASFWLDRPRRCPPLPRDHPPPPVVDLLAAEQVESVALDAKSTEVLLRRLPAVYGTRIDEVLLTAVLEAFAPWTGHDELLIDLEGHGRQTLSPGLDLSRTVGWFTATYPVHLRRRPGPVGDPRLPSLGRTLNSVRDQLAAIPRRGIGHGILYFRSPDPAVRGALRLLPRPEVSFNYLGQLDALLVHSRLFEVAPEPRGRERSPRMRRPYLLEIDGGVVEGRLWINWRYSENHHRRDTIRQLGQRFLAALGRLIDPCRERPSGRHPAALDERTFPLAPLQEGLLFHSLLSPRDPLYCEQNSWRLRGPLDPGRWRRAWRLLFERHPALRVGIVWRGHDRPRQRIAERFLLPWFELDLRALPRHRREGALRRALSAQRRMGFDLERPPLTRLMLVQLDDDRWRFAWTTHHLLLDGWSLASLFDELFTIDDALRRDQLPPRPTRRPFREVVEWFERRDPTPAESFFRDLLKGFEGPTPVVPRPAPRESALGRRVQVRLPSARRRELEAWGRSRGLTLATLLQATWGLLLARRARRSDAVFGLVVSGRSLPIEGIDTVVGLLINTLPMRVSTAPGKSLGHWLRDLQRVHLELQQHGHLALSAIRRQLGLAADLPLFESILGFQNYPSHRAFLERRGAVTVEAPWSATGVHYPLALAVLPEDTITLDLGFDPRRIDPLDAHRIVRQLRTLLEGLCQRQDSDSVASLPWLERGERHQLLWEWNHHPTPAAPPEAPPWTEVGPPFPHRFDRQVARDPEALAVVQGQRRWTYRHLAERVAGRVARLRRHRIGREQRVAVLLDRSPDQVATVLAVWSVGAVLVPLDPLAPVGRWQSLLGEAGVEALVTEADHLERLPTGALPQDARVVDLSQPDPSPLRALRSATDSEDRPFPLEPDQLAYILFTSGSTGRPKGAMVTHRGLANLSREPSFAARPGERVLQLATPAFDASIWELVAALGHGGTLELLPKGEPPAGAELEALLAAGPIHRALIPPSWLATLPAEASERLPHLDPLLVGGEPCPPELVRRWARGRRLVNAYGPTEVTVCSAVHSLGPDDRRIVVGRPLAGLRILVLDRCLDPVPVGVVGEVVLAGAGLARGYLGRPARTAAVFVPDPEATSRATVETEAGGRLYRTGDLGRWSSEGTLEILGRSDHQVKIRGVRLELGEVETALESLSEIAQAVVLVEGEVGTPGRRLVAHVRPADTGAAGEAAVDGWRRALLDRLPKALVPAGWVVHPELPRTPQGKIDRVALAAATANAASSAGGDGIDATALDPREELVARLWAEILDRPAPRDRRADFFELGGHSLLATQVAARVPRIFGVDLPLRELFEHPTIGRLATRIGELRNAAAAVDQVTIESDPECLDGPLSFAQERLWFLQQLEPASSAYNSPRAFTLEGPLDGIALEGALRGLVERQAVLRTRYRMRGGRPRQRIEPVPARVLSTVDLTGLPLDRRPDTAHDLLEHDAATPFDLARGPLFRAWLLVLAPERNLLLLNFHHSVLDAASLDVLTHDLEALYRRHRGRPDSGLRPLPVRYLDFALWQRATLDEARQRLLLESWRALGGAEPLPMFELPLDRPRPAHPRGHGRFHRRPLAADTVTAIEGLARRHGATPYMVLLAHLVLWLRRLADRSKVVLGTPIANRSHPSLEPLVGFFVNALVLRLEVRRHDTVDDLIDRTRDHVLATWDLQDLPFERLVQALRPRRRAGEHPLFQVSFTVRSPQPEERRLDDLRWRSLRLQHPRVRFDLEIYARLSDSGIEIEIGYDLDLLDATTIERWSQGLALLLDHGVLHPGARVATLPWLRPAEVQQLIREWPRALDAAPPWQDPWSAILERARRAPHAVALTLGKGPQTGGDLSYGELLARVTPVDAALRRRGVGCEALVGVELDRSTGWLVALLATLAAGAVFVPVDPRDPQGRRDAMLGRLPLALRIVAEDAPEATSAVPRLRLHSGTGELVDATPMDVAGADDPSGDRSPTTDGLDSPFGTALAYAIHTSGTTGSPKAIGVSRQALGLHLAAIGRAYGLGPWDRVLWQASPAFDVSIEQTLAPLVWGATVVLGPRGVLERGGLVRALVSQGVTVANLPPALWSWLANSERSTQLGSGAGDRSTLRLMVVGGDAMPAATLDPWFGGPWSSARLLDAYGPTEAVITASLEEVSASGPRSTQQPPSPGLPIGRPVAGRTLRVVDRLAAPVPMGVVGELVLGGEALARGLLADPRATAERFRPDPWSDRPGARVLWSGDRARRTSDGRLEFFGRRDRQLEMRGIRIEPGEVESALASHDGVREVWVGLSPNRDDPRLTAWIAGEPSALRTLGRRHQLEHWKAVYQTLHGPDPEAGTIDGDRFLGWTSVLDGAPIPRPAMEDWLDQTVERVLALRPSRLLEIGCGHGLILESVAEHCREVVGTDLSAAALAHLEQRLARDGGPRFELLAQAAHDFRHLETRQFDTIVLNSVVQYFPDLDYLIQVLEGAVAHLAWGGALFLGDVRSLPLLDLLHTLALRSRDSEAATGSAGGRRRRPRQEGELVLDPFVFLALGERLPRLAGIHLRPKIDRHGSELVRFRYDVSLWFDRAPDLQRPHLGESETLQILRGDRGFPTLEHHLDRGTPLIRLDGIRPWRHGEGSEIRRLRNLLQHEPYAVELMWPAGDVFRRGNPGPVDSVRLWLRRHPEADARSSQRPLGSPAAAWSTWATNPSRATGGEALVAELRRHLESLLPAAMRPAAYVLLDRLPRGPRAKVEARFLPPPGRGEAAPPSAAGLASGGGELAVGQTVGAGGETPRTPEEQRLAVLWADLLGLDEVPRDRTFFELGGHSLLATRLLASIRREHGIEISLRWFFGHPTVAELARRLTSSGRRPARPGPTRRRGPGPAPLSHAQERLWFLDQLEPGDPSYHLGVAYRLRGPLEVGALRRALVALEQRQDSLRTIFPAGDDGPSQVLEPATDRLLVVDLGGLGARAAEPALGHRLRHRLSNTAFALDQGPLTRAVLLRRSVEDHELMLVQHHIVSDGWSLALVLEQLGSLYGSALRGEARPTPPRRPNYADYASWQRRRLDDGTLDPSREFWRRQLRDAPRLDLPTDHPRDRRPARGDSVPVRIDPTLGARLEGLAREHGASVYMMLLAAFGELLSRWAGQGEVVLGSPVANRPHDDLETLVGFFVNTVVLRTATPRDDDFAGRLTRVRDVALAAFAHSEVPFDVVVGDLSPQRSLGRNPLFQVSLGFQNTHLARRSVAAPSSQDRPGEAGPEGLRLEGLEVEALELPLTAVVFELELHLWPVAGALEGFFAFRRDLFDRTTVLRLAGRLERLLAAVSSAPERPLHTLDLMATGERHQLLVEWSTALPSPRPAPPVTDVAEGELWPRVEGWVRRSPRHPAIELGERRWSYRQLERRVAALGHRLRDLGVGVEVPVGVCYPPGLDGLVAMLAIHAVGGVAVPLDPTHPPARRAALLAQVGAHWILGDVDPTDTRVAAINPPDPREIETTPPLGRPVVDATAAAYILFTSGSTGRPKPVPVSRGALERHLQAMQRDLPLETDDVVLVRTSPAFDPSLWELWAPLLVGARLVIADRATRQDPRRMVRLLQRRRIRVSRVSPALLGLLLDEADFGRLETLRRLLCGGEALPTALVERFRSRGPSGTTLVNVYGPTETTINVAYEVLPTESPERRDSGAPGSGAPGSGAPSSIALGRPLGDARWSLLGPGQRPVALGEVGELTLSGPTLARGYARRPAETAQVFVPVAGSDSGARQYRSGDRARWLPDGRVQFLGRRDQQVQLRGFRIELGEVEAALRELSQAHDSLAMVRRLDPADRSREPVLVGFVVSLSPSPDTSGWMTALRSRLPPFMIPSLLVPLETLPRTASGKIDRRRLSRLPLDRGSGPQGRAPRDPREELLAALFAEGLGLDRIDVDRDFFELGGHSLLATRVVSRIRRVFGCSLDLATFFSHPTVGELALHLDPGGEEHKPWRAGPRPDPLPLSAGQRRLWFLSQLDPTDSAYNMPVAVALRGPLDPATLARAWGRLRTRHESLRTHFPSRSGTPHQAIEAADSPWRMPVLDLSSLPRQRADAVAHRLVGREADRPFDLARGPLVRLHLVHLGDRAHQLWMVFHHTIADGWSKGLVLGELLAFYRGLTEGVDPVLPPLPLQPADVAVLEEQEQERTDDEVEARWRDRLSDLQPLRLPTDRPRPTRRASRGGAVPLRVPRDALAALRRSAERAPTTPFMTLLATVVAWLRRLTGQNDFALASPMARRHREELEPLVGFFVDTLVLRVDGDDDPNLPTLLKRLRQVVLEGMDRRAPGLDRLVQLARPERDPSRTPLVDVSVSLHQGETTWSAPGMLKAHELEIPSHHAQFDLDFDLWLVDDELEGLLTYRRDLFDATTIERWVGQWSRLLVALGDDPDRPLSHRGLLAPAEHHQLLWEWGCGPLPTGNLGIPIHRRIFDQARRQPDEPAVIYDSPLGIDVLSYGELAELAYVLAHELLDAGVTVETPVAVVAPRGPALVVGILAVLAAGGTWVALDPGEPAQRLAEIARNAAIDHAVVAPDLDPPLPWEPAVEMLIPELGTVEPEGEPPDLPDTDPDQLAYLVHTSGSTGRPKGVMVTHGGWVNAFEAWRSAYDLDRLRRHLQAAGSMFDVFAGDFARALASGGTLVVAPREVTLDPAALTDFVELHDVETGELVPAVARGWLEHLEREHRDLGPIELLVVGSDRWPSDDLQRLRRLAGPRRRLVNSYGLSEATIDSTWYEDLAEHPTRGARVPIGRPFAGSRTRVVDDRLALRPIGAVGELAVAGVGLARGYLDDPARTAQRFVPDPGSPSPGGRLYRTGDAVRLDAEGNLDVLGRLDQQLKVRGLRVEPGEIEALVVRLADLREAAVVAVTTGTGGPTLVAWLVPRDGTRPPSPRDLRDLLRQHLPLAMVPTRFESLDRLPRNRNGKIDRAELVRRSRPTAPAAEGQGGEPPRGAIETTLAALWSELLETADGDGGLGRDADFFELGGHSLLVTRLAAGIRRTWGIEVGLGELFAAPGLADQAALIRRRRPDPSPPGGDRSDDG